MSDQTVPTPPNTRDEIREIARFSAIGREVQDTIIVDGEIRSGAHSFHTIGDYFAWLDDVGIEAADNPDQAVPSVASALTLRQTYALQPAENMALTVALAQLTRGEVPMPNIASVCVLALARLRAIVDGCPQ